MITREKKKLIHMKLEWNTKTDCNLAMICRSRPKFLQFIVKSQI